MNASNVYDLHPFNQPPEGKNLQLKGGLDVKKHTLKLSFELSGDLSSVYLPELESELVRKRRAELWKSTCFEAFLAPEEGKAYWEVNLAPHGDWDFYEFSNYRCGMTQVSISTFPQVAVKTEDSLWRCEAHIDVREVNPLYQALLNRSLRFSISAVLEHSTGSRSFWSLRHCGAEPDFHLRESFVGKL